MRDNFNRKIIFYYITEREELRYGIIKFKEKIALLLLLIKIEI